MEKSKPKITFFKSGICPRCFMAARELKNLKKKYPDLEIVEIDILLHPLLTLKNNIRMVPALKGGSLILSGLFLSRKQINRFTENYMQSLEQER